ncbi:MAG: PqiB family protein [Desulforhopalus sp.]
MTEKADSSRNEPSAASPVIRERRSISIVWLIPVVAILIGGYLAYTAVTEKGPVITISFLSAEGLESGKTKVKFKDVEVGVVETIEIGENLSQVLLKVQMKKGTEEYLTENTQFWVVRARITSSQVSGLGTLLGGAYIGIEPSTQGKSQAHFKGLEIPPLVTREMKGRRFVLNASRLGSLNPGSPIYFRQIHVGQVTGYRLEDDGTDVEVNVFINSPYDRFVRRDTRFWLASGLDLKLTAAGLTVDTESVVSLLIGGIAFNSLANDAESPVAEENSRFTLYDSFLEARDARYTSKNDFYVEFSESVRGLSVGAPLEFRGFQIGTVVDMELQTDFKELEFSTMVRVSVEKERLPLQDDTGEDNIERFTRMANNGLRAQLKPGNLLTGQLFVDIEFHDGLPPPEIKHYKNLPVLPSLVSPSREIMQQLSQVMKKVDNLPLEEIGRDLQKSIAAVDRLVNGPDLKNGLVALERILTELKATTQAINGDTVPRINSTVSELETLLKNMDRWVERESPLYGELLRMMEEFSDAARAVNDLAEMLERQPEALLRGKKSENR